MLKSQKITEVSNLESTLKNSSTVVVTHYHGLSVSEMTKLRSSLREENAKLKVSKNTLIKKAANNIGYDFDLGLFSGPVAIACSEDPVSAAKQTVKFAKDHEKLEIKGGIIDGKLVDVATLQAIAKLPSLDELRGKIIGVLQAPASKLVRTLNAPATNVLNVLKAYSEK